MKMVVVVPINRDENNWKKLRTLIIEVLHLPHLNGILKKHLDLNGDMTYIKPEIIDGNRKDDLIKLAERYLGYDSIHIWNANLSGYIIQLRTNSQIIYDFFQENFFPSPLDKKLRPHGTVYAIVDIPGTEPEAFYHFETHTGIIFNMNDYFSVRSLALAIVFDVTEKTDRLHFLRGSLLDLDGEGICLMGQSGSMVTTHSFMLLEIEKARIHSSDLIYLERLGGQKGRISTLAPERKFYLNNNIAQINPHIKSLFDRCKKEQTYFMLDPWWIGGEEKCIETTRIKVVFILKPMPTDSNIIRRLSKKEAMTLLLNEDPAFMNPYKVITNRNQLDLLKIFFSRLFDFSAVYLVNSAFPMFDVQNRLRQIVTSKEYLEPLEEIEEEFQFEIYEIFKQIDLQKIRNKVKEVLQQSNVKSLTETEIKEIAHKHGTPTKFGNYNFVSTVKNRSAPLTVYIGGPKVVQSSLNERQKEIIRNIPQTIEDVFHYFKKADFITSIRTMGENSDYTPRCTLILSVHRKEMIRIAHMVNSSLFPDNEETNEEKNPQLYIVYIPEWQEKDRQILVFPEVGVTFVLGSDYFGEVKKGFLRMAMFTAKSHGMLGLHAGAKIVAALDKKENKLKRYGMIIFGLTATGKTTHSTHTHDLDEKLGEGIKIIQDDFIALREDGSAIGCEKGFYLKTDSVDPKMTPLIYNAVIKENAIFENVMVDYLGNVFFQDETLTGNGRGIMQKDDFGKYMNDKINLPPISELDGMIILLITRRNTVVPMAAKLTTKQAAAAFMLGESIHTSGSDPRRAGESIRIVGTNPFIVGSESEEGNRFYDLIKPYEEKIRCYQINTGGIGEIMETDEYGRKIYHQKVERIPIKEMAAIIRGIIRDSIEWVDEPYFGVKIPKNVEDIDYSNYEPKKYYSTDQIEKYVDEIKRERKEYMKKYTKLYPIIANAFKH